MSRPAGFTHSIKTRKKIGHSNSISKKGVLQVHLIKYWTGRPKSEASKQKNRESHTGEKNPWYIDGREKLNNPYPEEWEFRSKEAKIRDNFTCRICKKYPAPAVHHINYDKQNCELDNLITLCNSCHAKTNTHRNYWKEFFKQLIFGR